MRRLILASSSPRRSLLLRERGFEPEVVRPRIDDAELAKPAQVSPLVWVSALAYLKGRAVLDALTDAGKPVVLAADTVVVKGGRVIGQPRDAAHARAIIETLEDGSHTVATGVAILGIAEARVLLLDSARVSVGRIGPEKIEEYVESGDWQGKAGAYNLVERIGAGWPITYEGDPGTIMGLPMEILTPVLARMLNLDCRADR